MTQRKRDEGITLVVLMVVIVIATLLGIWGLSSSRLGILKAGNKAAENRLQLMADQGLQKGLRRVQEIMNYEYNLTDAVATKLSVTPKTAYWLDSGGGSSGATIINPGSQSSSSEIDPACAFASNTNTGLDVITGKNVVCNFLGTSIKDTQVILVRKADLTVTQSEVDAVFLLNAIATDSAGRKQVCQGVIVAPYDEGTGLAKAQPYIATDTCGAD